MTPETLNKSVLWRGMILAGGIALLCGFAATKPATAVEATSAGSGAVALSQPPSESRICEKLTARLERLCQRNYLSDANEALCAQVEEGLPGLCGDLDLILATPAAEGSIPEALELNFSLRLVEEEDDLRDLTLHPLIVAPEDLEDRYVTDYLAVAYASGMTVAIVGASQEEAKLFHNLAGAAGTANCAPDADAWAITFYGLHRSIVNARPSSQNGLT